MSYEWRLFFRIKKKEGGCPHIFLIDVLLLKKWALGHNSIRIRKGKENAICVYTVSFSWIPCLGCGATRPLQHAHRSCSFFYCYITSGHGLATVLRTRSRGRPEQRNAGVVVVSGDDAKSTVSNYLLLLLIHLIARARITLQQTPSSNRALMNY